MPEITEISLDQIQDHPDNPRYSSGEVEALADSIRELGVLEPVILSWTEGDDEFVEHGTVLSGHRRVAAARVAGLESVPAIIVDSAERSYELSVLLATNTAREALKTVEEAHGYQTMLDLGVPVTKIAKALGRKAERVKAAAAAVKALAADQVTRALERAVSFDELEVLERHAGNEQRFGDLLEKVGTCDFEWAARGADSDAKREVVHERAQKKLQAAGVKIVKASVGQQAPLRWLRDSKGKALTAKAHASCPGHAAILNDWSSVEGDAIEYVCRDWQKHGHKNVYASPVDGKDAETRQRENAWRKRMKTVVETRRAWLKALLAGKQQIAGAEAYLLEAALHRGFTSSTGLACELLGIEPPNHDSGGLLTWNERLDEKLKTKDPIRAMLALACADGDEATRLSKPPAEVKSYYGDWRHPPAVRYLSFLEVAGYVLTDVERELVEAPERAREGTEAADDTGKDSNTPDDPDGAADPAEDDIDAALDG